MSKRVCPWWLGYFLAGSWRRLIHDPARILAPYVRAGMIVLEPGPGMGFFTLELARLVGASGRVIAVDVQSRMLDGLRRRAAKAGLSERIEARLALPDSLNISDLGGKVDFVFAFAVVHELPSAAPFFVEVAEAMHPAAQLLMSEPSGHVNAAKFEDELQSAERAGLKLVDRPSIRRCRTALLKKA